MPTKYVEVQGCATYYYYAGQTTLPDVVPDFSRGRKVVMLHGAGSNGHSWHNQVDHLGRSHSPLAIDLPAHGRSAGVDGLITVQEYSDFVVAFLDALGIGSAVIAGRSMGGALPMGIALRSPRPGEASAAGVAPAPVNIPPQAGQALD